jgi:hypothetical protein
VRQAHGIKQAMRTYRDRVRSAVAPRAQPAAHVSETGSATANPLSIALHGAFAAAMENRHRVDRNLLELSGMSGRKYRAFINKLISSLERPRYLEVGVWAGSTLCAAIHGNNVTAMAIDNWSQFDGPADMFFRNLGRFRGPGSQVSFLERDFRRVDYGAIGTFNIFLFDGPHEEKDQYHGVVLAQPALDDDHVLIVDDWNGAPVRVGTERAIRDLGLTVNYSIELRTTLDDSYPSVAAQRSDWHNGYFFASVTKKAPR